MFATQEQKILDRLREKLGPDVHVGPVRDLERVAEMRQKAPAAWVIYDGFRVGPTSGQAAAGVQMLIPDWFVVLTAKSSRGNGDSMDARDQASALAQATIEALLGFPVGPGQYLRVGESPGPEYDAGYCHVPLAFTATATFKGKP